MKNMRRILLLGCAVVVVVTLFIKTQLSQQLDFSSFFSEEKSPTDFGLKEVSLKGGTWFRGPSRGGGAPLNNHTSKVKSPQAASAVGSRVPAVAPAIQSQHCSAMECLGYSVPAVTPVIPANQLGSLGCTLYDCSNGLPFALDGCCLGDNCCTACDPCCLDNPCDDSLLWYLSPSFLYRGGDGRGYPRGYATAAAFLALYDPVSRDYPFVDLRAHWVGDRQFAGNVGLGWRSFLCDYCQMFGANVYYDYRHIRHGKHLQQVGVGLELLGSCWDFRANGYIPVGSKRPVLKTTEYDFVGGFVAISHKTAFALWGADFEIGKTVWCNRLLNLYIAAGPYFYGREPFENIIGGMARFDLIICRNLEARVYVTYDRCFRTKVQGEVMLTLRPCCTCCWDCLFNRVERNEIIVKRDACCWDTNF